MSTRLENMVKLIISQGIGVKHSKIFGQLQTKIFLGMLPLPLTVNNKIISFPPIIMGQWKMRCHPILLYLLSFHRGGYLPHFQYFHDCGRKGTFLASEIPTSTNLGEFHAWKSRSNEFHAAFPVFGETRI